MSNVTEITGNEDTLDSRDIQERIEILELVIDKDEPDWETEYESEIRELGALKNFRELMLLDDEDAWDFGITFINESFFEDYAQETAEDIGAIDPHAKWPLNHIDWEAAADELKSDFSSIELMGATYWYN